MLSQYEKCWERISAISEEMNRFAGALSESDDEVNDIEYDARLKVLLVLAKAMGTLPRHRRIWKLRIEPRWLSTECKVKTACAFKLYDAYKKTFMDPWYAAHATS